MKRSALTILIVLQLLSGYLFAQRVINGQVINKKETWSGKILIRGDVVIGKKGHLVIEPGAQIEFAPHLDVTSSGKDKSRSELIVKGVLIVKGQYDNKVIFTSASKTPRMGDWYGMRFLNPRESSIIDYSEVKFANDGITIKKSSPVIRSTQLVLNYNSGILIQVKATPVISKNIISENGYAGVIATLGSQPVLVDNLISQNQIGIIVLSSAQPLLGDLSGTRKMNIGKNIFSDNIEYDLYNHSKKNIIAENNNWSTSRLSEIRARIFDADDDNQYGSVDFLPLYTDSDLSDFLQLSQDTAPATNTNLSGITPPVNNTTTAENDAAKQAETGDDGLEDNAEQLRARSRARSVPISGLKRRDIKPNAVQAVTQINFDQIFMEPFLDKKKAEVIKRVAPEVTDQIIRLGTKGRVHVRIVVAKDGDVESAMVVKGLNAVLDNLAEKAALKFKYKPGTIKNRPVRFYTTLLFEF